MPVDKSMSQNATPVWITGADGNPVYPGGSTTGQQPAASSQSVTPASDTTPFPVQGANANGTAPTANPVLTAGIDAGGLARRNFVSTNGATVLGDATGTSTMRVDTIGAHVFSKGGTTIATGQVNVATTATLVANARTGRQKVTLTPTTNTVFYVGTSAVTTATGLFVPAGASITLDTAAAVYAIGSAALTISYIEFY